MNLHDQLIDDLTGFFDISEFAEEVKYCAQGSTSYKIIKIIPTESGDYGIQSDVPISDRMLIEVASSDILSPNYRDEFLIPNSSGEDQEWFLLRYVSGGSKTGTLILELTKSSRE